jgi:hypothetical protein
MKTSPRLFARDGDLFLLKCSEVDDSENPRALPPALSAASDFPVHRDASAAIC